MTRWYSGGKEGASTGEQTMNDPKPIPPRTLKRVESYLTDAEIAQIDAARSPRESRSQYIANACRAEAVRRGGGK